MNTSFEAVSCQKVPAGELNARRGIMNSAQPLTHSLTQVKFQVSAALILKFLVFWDGKLSGCLTRR